MANIYELTDDMRTIQALIEQGELDPEALKDALSVTKEELSFKLEAYCKVIKNMESDIAGLKAEEKRLSEKRQSLENAIDRMKEAMKGAVETAAPEDRKMIAGTFTVGVQNNPPKVVIDDPYIENIPERYLVHPEPTINKKLMLEDFKNDGLVPDLEGIAHVEVNTSIRIR